MTLAASRNTMKFSKSVLKIKDLNLFVIFKRLKSVELNSKVLKNL